MKIKKNKGKKIKKNKRLKYKQLCHSHQPVHGGDYEMVQSLSIRSFKLLDDTTLFFNHRGIVHETWGFCFLKFTYL